MEYVELQLCRDVYHCLPSELAEEDWATVRTHLALLTGESRVIEARQSAARARQVRPTGRAKRSK